MWNNLLLSFIACKTVLFPLFVLFVAVYYRKDQRSTLLLLVGVIIYLLRVEYITSLFSVEFNNRPASLYGIGLGKSFFAIYLEDYSRDRKSYPFVLGEFSKTEKIRFGIFYCSGIVKADREFIFQLKSDYLCSRKTVVVYYPTTEPIVSAIFLGDKRYLPTVVQAAVERLGVSHYLVVSGLHFMFLFSIFRLLPLPFALRIVFLFLGGTAYLLILGFPLPAFRAWMFAVVYIVSRVRGFKIDTKEKLSFAAVILMLVDPLSLRSLSFQYSFAAVAGIVFFRDKLEKLLEYLPFKKSVSVSLAAQIPVSLLTEWYFGNLVPLGFLWSVLFFPLFFITFLFSLLVVFLKVICNLELHLPTSITDIWYSLFFIKIPLIVSVVWPSLFTLVFFILVCKKKKVVLFTALSLLDVKDFHNGTVIFGYNNGEFAVFINDDKVVVIDTGGIGGGKKVASILSSYGIREVDYVIITHHHLDHCEGLLELDNRLKINKLLVSSPGICNYYLRSNVFDIVNAGESLEIGEAKIDFLWPVEVSTLGVNSNSLVFKLYFKGKSFLFTGDISVKEEKKLVLMYREKLKSHFLKSPHHGSKGSNSLVFLSYVSPSVTVISARSFSSSVVRKLLQFGEVIRVNGLSVYTLKEEQLLREL